MTAPASKADLGSLFRRPPCCPSIRGQLFYLPRTRAIVTPERRTGEQWQCLVLAAAAESTRRVSVPDAELETATTVLTVDPDLDPAGYALLWQARVWQRWPGGVMPTLARMIADDLRTPRGLAVDLPAAAIRRLAHGCRMLPSALHLRINQLVAAGLLRPVRPDIGRHWGSYTMSIPDRARSAAA
jgi:hypothetical protein